MQYKFFVVKEQISTGSACCLSDIIGEKGRGSVAISWIERDEKNQSLREF